MEHPKIVESDYKGCHIFRQQPNHSYFDKPFNDPEDCMFQAIHEIDPYFLKDERKAERIDYMNSILIDPRTKKPVNKIYYDYTKDEEEKTSIFLSPKKSFMKIKEHELGVRVLNLLQHRMEVEEEDMYKWYILQTVRSREKEYFQKFVFAYCQNNKESLYAPCRRFFMLYQKWYKRKAMRLIKRYSPETYNTYLGLPQVRMCKNVLSDQQVHIKNLEIVANIGELCVWPDVKEEFKKLNHTLEAYAKAFEDSEDLKELLEDDLKQQFDNIMQQAPPETPCLYMPLESLLFLVTAGDYVDLPTEMLLNIKEVDRLHGEPRKYIVMDLPLPSRQGGWHSYEQVAEQAVLAMVSIKQLKCSENDAPEIQATIDPTNCSKIYTVTEFMDNCKYNADKLCKFSKRLTKWQLCTDEDEMKFQIYTSLDSFAENQSLSLKLEYKPQLGCEVLTKYKTLKEWFKLKLMGATESSCLRLDVTNFQTLLEEQLTIDKLEGVLNSMYHLKCNELLNNLFEFLKMLYGMPLGHYMLRYNPKYKDKILLCTPSQERTQNNIHLHELINDDVKDIEFISQQNCLPIDEDLCNKMHLQHKIMPAAFSPFVEASRCNKTSFCTVENNKSPQAKKQTKKWNKPKIADNGTASKKPMNKSKRKRANRRRRQFEALKAKSNGLRDTKDAIEKTTSS